jgi:hypothetical protein
LVQVSTYPSHENDAVNAHFPFLAKHLPRLLPKDTWCLGILASLLRFDELLGFGEADTDQTNGYRDTGANPKDSLPGLH